MLTAYWTCDRKWLIRTECSPISWSVIKSSQYEIGKVSLSKVILFIKITQYYWSIKYQKKEMIFFLRTVRKRHENAQVVQVQAEIHCLLVYNFKFSMMVTLAMPPPSHMVCRPHFFLSRIKPCTRVLINFAPLAPSG